MKVYLINLDADRDRLAAADARLRALGVPYERVKGVYGKDLNAFEKKNAVNRMRWWCSMGRVIMDGEIGCALSHQKVYRRMVEKGDPLACVLEDDVVITDAFPRLLAWLESHFEAAVAQVALLSNHTGVKLMPPGKGECSLDSSCLDMFAEGYVLTLAAAKNILAKNCPIQVPADHWPRWVRQGAIRLYHALPAVCSQNWTDFHSRTDAPTNLRPVSSLSLPAYCLHKFKRVIGKTIDNLLILLRI